METSWQAVTSTEAFLWPAKRAVVTNDPPLLPRQARPELGPQGSLIDELFRLGHTFGRPNAKALIEAFREVGVKVDLMAARGETRGRRNSFGVPVVRIFDADAASRAHARQRSEVSGDTKGPFEAMHIVHRGMGGGGITCDLNYVLGTRKEHLSYHSYMPAFTQFTLFEIVARRYGTTAEEVERELRRLQALDKFADPNEGRPSWAPVIPASAYQRRVVRRITHRRRSYRVVAPKVPR